MRGAIWRSRVTGPGRICLACNGRYHPSHVTMEKDESLDDPTYIASLANDHPLQIRQNVSMLSRGAASAYISSVWVGIALRDCQPPPIVRSV